MRVITAFRRRTPRAKPFDLWSHIAASGVRGSAIEQAKRKAAQAAGGARLLVLVYLADSHLKRTAAPFIARKSRLSSTTRIAARP